MSGPGAIAFDLDGTLVHSAPDLHAAANVMLATLGRRTLSLGEVTSFVGNGVPKLVERCVEATGGPDPRAIDLFRTHYDAHPADLTRLYPGAEDMLTHLIGAGYVLGICTNKPEAPTQTILHTLGLDSHFGAVVGGDTLPVKKPDPAPLTECFQRLGGTPLLYVGDSEIDAATARAAHIPFALFSAGYRRSPVDQIPHDHLFDDLAEIPGLLTR